MNLPIRVIIADGYNLSIKVLERFFAKNESINIVASANEAKDVFKKLNDFPADVILLDLSIQRLDGLQVISYIKSLFPRLKIIIYSMIDDPEILHRAFDLGAAGFITKDADYKQVEEAIQFAANGGKFLCRQATQSVKSDRYFDMFMRSGELKNQAHSQLNN